jgi:hypothetical protein
LSEIYKKNIEFGEKAKLRKLNQFNSLSEETESEYDDEWLS